MLIGEPSLSFPLSTSWLLSMAPTLRTPTSLDPEVLLVSEPLDIFAYPNREGPAGWSCEACAFCPFWAMKRRNLSLERLRLVGRALGLCCWRFYWNSWLLSTLLIDPFLKRSSFWLWWCYNIVWVGFLEKSSLCSSLRSSYLCSLDSYGLM